MYNKIQNNIKNKERIKKFQIPKKLNVITVETFWKMNFKL